MDKRNTQTREVHARSKSDNQHVTNDYLSPSSLCSDPPSMRLPSLQSVHQNWLPTKVSTAKCDMCHRQRCGTIQKCDDCKLSVCKECSSAGRLRDGRHVLDHAAVNWDGPSTTYRQSDKVSKKISVQESERSDIKHKRKASKIKVNENLLRRDRSVEREIRLKSISPLTLMTPRRSTRDSISSDAQLELVDCDTKDVEVNADANDDIDLCSNPDMDLDVHRRFDKGGRAFTQAPSHMRVQSSPIVSKTSLSEKTLRQAADTAMVPHASQNQQVGSQGNPCRLPSIASMLDANILDAMTPYPFAQQPSSQRRESESEQSPVVLDQFPYPPRNAWTRGLPPPEPVEMCHRYDVSSLPVNSRYDSQPSNYHPLPQPRIMRDAQRWMETRPSYESQNSEPNHYTKNHLGKGPSTNEAHQEIAVQILGTKLQNAALDTMSQHRDWPLDQCLRLEVERMWSSREMAPQVSVDPRRAFHVLLAATYFASICLKLPLKNAAREWHCEQEQRLWEQGYGEPLRCTSLAEYYGRG